MALDDGQDRFALPLHAGTEIGVVPPACELPSLLLEGALVLQEAEAVNLYEAPASRNYWAACSVSGLLIHAVVGSLGGWGSLRTKRPGWAGTAAGATSAP